MDSSQDEKRISLYKQIQSGFQISEINLTSSNLYEFPIELYSIHSTIKFINLGSNHLTHLPSQITTFHSLKTLFLSQNNFTEFPIILSSLSNLFMLSFKSNQLTHIPENALSSSIGWLILTDNKIKSLPKDIGKLTFLRKCMLSSNELVCLPDEMKSCKNIELLRLAANKLERLPGCLFELPRLAWIALAGNPCIEPVGMKHDALHTIGSIDYSRLLVGDILGQGASGMVYKAQLNPLSNESIKLPTLTESNVNPPLIESISSINPPLQVAIKLFKGDSTSDGLPRDEMKSMEYISPHPNLPKVHGKLINTPQNQQGLVLDLIPPHYKILGNPPSFESITRDTFPKEMKLSIKQCINYSKFICSVMCHLHDHYLCHGDLYCHNILVSNAPIHCYLTDFGASFLYIHMSEYERTMIQSIEVRAFGWFLKDLIGMCDETNPVILNVIDMCFVDTKDRISFKELNKILPSINV